MKTKFLLPVLAMIFAIGMSFTTVDSTNPNNDYVYLDSGSWLEIDELECGVGNISCRAQLGEGGPIYQVYDKMDLLFPKSGNSEDPIIVNP